MTWTRLDDDFNDRPALLAVGRSARLLHVEALVWCNRLLTDGAVPRGALPRLTDSPDLDADVAELVAAELWEETTDGWQLDWSDQEEAAAVRARQDVRNERQKRYRRRKSKHDSGDHSECDERYCKQAVTHNGHRHEGGNDDRRVTPSRPGPSRPDPKGGTEGRDAGAVAPSAGATGARLQPGEVGVLRTASDGRHVMNMGGGGDEW
ncbi:hypothetical protein [Promicromonospora iranensis]|uniref:DUF1376 domain-containing protein n=1 Tax=Promicromonospora iranensis TaxID=1105144 RepID=A0ABU2CWH5_9MICO|nr:hypothetical protein [Promicromonospora iranensis]MDR7385680.1 hypothetical protein [Promicromonospora iranensis]